MEDLAPNTGHPRPVRKQPPEHWHIILAATWSHIAQLYHDRELKMEQSILGDVFEAQMSTGPALKGDIPDT